MEKPRMTSGLFSLGNFVSAGTISHAIPSGVIGILTVSYTHLTLPTNVSMCRSRWSPYH